jgi:omega-6 fatty acid desaturase (delta-12 desaturase)
VCETGLENVRRLVPRRIPNYDLEKCHKAEPLFQTVPPVTLFSSLKSITFRRWDEKRYRLVGFSHL